MRSFFFIIFGLVLNSSFGQLTIQSIDFVGLNKTNEFYVRSYLKLEVGDLYDSVALKKDIQSLRNHQIFSSVDAVIDSLDTMITITYHCIENISLLPIISFGGVKDNFYTQLGFTNYNWLGRGARMSMYYMYYDRHSGSASFMIPRLNMSKFGVSVNINKYSTLEPLFFDNGTVFYEYDNNAVELLGIRELQQNHNILFGGTVFKESYRKDAALDYYNSPGPYSKTSTKQLIKLVHDFKSVNYYYHYLSGFSNYIFIENVWTENEKATFVKFVNESKFYKRLGSNGNLALRLKFGLSSNNVGPFAPFVLDSYVNIRGVGNRVDRGTGTLILNLEHRHTLWQPSWGAFQGVVFTDIGSWRQDGGRFKDFVELKNLQSFFGFGGRLVINQFYNSILRLDFGLDINNPNRNGIVLGLGQYF